MKMEGVVRRGGEASAPGATPPVAYNYLLMVMQNKYRDMSIRNLRELKTLTTILDCLSVGE